MKEPTTELQIVKPDPRYPKAKLIEPTTLGYLSIAAAVRPGPIPLVLPSAARSRLLKRYVTANLEVNCAGSMPIYYRLV